MVTAVQSAIVSDPRSAPSRHADPLFTQTAEPRWVISLVLLGGLPLTADFLRGLNDRPQYEFYPLLLLAISWLTYERWGQRFFNRQSRPSSVAMFSNGAGISLLALATYLYLRWLAWPAFLLLLAGAVWQLGGWGLFRRLVPCFVLLLTILPPPAHYDQLLLTELQRLAVLGSSRLLDLCDVPNLISGTTIEIPNHRLLVEQACSGINSVVSIAAFTLLYAFMLRRRVWRIVALLPIAVGFVLFVNLIRIVLGAILLTRGIDLLEPSVHAAVSFVMFLIGLGLTLSADQLLELMGDAARSAWRNEPTETEQNHRQATAIASSISQFEPESLGHASKTRVVANGQAANERNGATDDLSESAKPSQRDGAATLRNHENGATEATAGAMDRSHGEEASPSQNRRSEATASSYEALERSHQTDDLPPQNRKDEATETNAKTLERSHRADGSPSQNRRNEATTSLDSTKQTRWLARLNVAFAIISLSIGVWSYVRLRDCWPPSRLSGNVLFAPPTRIGHWQLIEGAGGTTQRIESVARYQHRWVYRNGDSVAEVSFAYPFNALYHDAAECYLYTGWTVDDRTFSHNDAGVLNTVSLIKPGESRGELVFGAFDEAGRPDLPPQRTAHPGWLQEKLEMSREAALHRPSCEIQALRVSTNRLSDHERADLRELFTAVRDELKQQTIARVES